MTAYCQHCGALIIGREVAGLFLMRQAPGTPEPTAEQIEDFQRQAEAARHVQNFDLLAGQMAAHLAEAHHAIAQEMAAAASLAGKVFAMTHAKSSDQNFDRLRGSWRGGVLHGVFGIQPETAAAAMSPSPAGSVSSIGTPSGS